MLFWQQETNTNMAAWHWKTTIPRIFDSVASVAMSLPLISLMPVLKGPSATPTPWPWSRPLSRPSRLSRLSRLSRPGSTSTSIEFVGSARSRRFQSRSSRSSLVRQRSQASDQSKPIKYGKWFTFWACFFGYSVCYFTRQSLSYTAPVLRQAMGWKGLSEIGKLQSLFPLAYGSSRFLGGLLGDLLSPKRVFALGLCVCSLLNIAFGLSSTLPQFAVFWLLNGCFQGLGSSKCIQEVLRRLERPGPIAVWGATNVIDIAYLELKTTFSTLQWLQHSNFD